MAPLFRLYHGKKMEQGKPGGKWAGVGAGRLLPEQLRWRLVVGS